MRPRTSQIDIDGVKYNEVFFPFSDGHHYCDAIYKCDENGVYTCLWKKIDEKVVYPYLATVIKTARAWYPVVYYYSLTGTKSLAYKNERVVSYADKEGFFVTGSKYDGSYDLWFCGGFLILTNKGIPISYAVMTKDGKQMHDMHNIVIDGTNSIGREIFKNNPYSSKYMGADEYITHCYVLTETESMYQYDSGIAYENGDDVTKRPYDANHYNTLIMIWFGDRFLWLEQTKNDLLLAHYAKNLTDEKISVMQIDTNSFGTWALQCIDYYYDKNEEKVYFLIGEFTSTYLYSDFRVISYSEEGLITEAYLDDYIVNPMRGGICKEGEYFFFWTTCYLYKTKDFIEIESVDLGSVPSNIGEKQVKAVVYDDESYKVITSEWSNQRRTMEPYIYTFSNNFASFEKEIIGIKVPENSGTWT